MHLNTFLTLTLCAGFATAESQQLTERHAGSLSRREQLFRDFGVAFSSLLRPRHKPLRRVVKRSSAVNAHNQCVLKLPAGPGVASFGAGGHSTQSQTSTQGHGATATKTTTPTTTPTSIYTKQLDSSGADFFDDWTFWSDGDPTSGTVQYTTQQAAQSSNLINITSSGNAIMRVDTTPVITGGRMSVRIQSKQTFTGGLWVLDALHIPTGCGTWPAFWTVGPNWPANGEIDIVEGVNGNTYNQASLHTAPGCMLDPNFGGTGTMIDGTICESNQTTNQGCGIMDNNPNSYGAGFNSNGGGVYAMLWDASGISIWFFPRTAIPQDLTSEAPIPTNWGAPSAAWPASTCPPYTYNQNQTTIFDTTLCGDWAGSAWASPPNGGGESCAQKTGFASCSTFVQQAGANFTEAYWEVSSVKVYQTT